MECSVGPVVGRVEGFYSHYRRGKRTALGDEEGLLDGGLLLRIGVEVVLRALGLDIAVALRGEGVPSGGERPQPPAVAAGKLVDGPECRLARGEDADETAVLGVPDVVAYDDAVAFLDLVALGDLLAVEFAEELPRD